MFVIILVSIISYIVCAGASSAAPMAAQQVMSPDARLALWTLLLAVLIVQTMAIVVWLVIQRNQLGSHLADSSVIRPPVSENFEAAHRPNCSIIGCRRANCDLHQNSEHLRLALNQETIQINRENRGIRRRNHRSNRTEVPRQEIPDPLIAAYAQRDRAREIRDHNRRVLNATMARRQAARNLAPPPAYERPATPVIPLRRENRQIRPRMIPPIEIQVDTETIVHRDDIPAPQQVDQVD